MDLFNNAASKKFAARLWLVGAQNPEESDEEEGQFLNISICTIPN